MTVATKLRLASGVVIAVLVAILAVALYVPTRLSSSANEKYGNDAIPFQRDVQGLLRQKLEQKAAADRYSLTRDEESNQRYINAQANVNFRLNRLTFYSDRLPGLDGLIREATIRSGDVDFELIQ